MSTDNQKRIEELEQELRQLRAEEDEAQERNRRIEGLLKFNQAKIEAARKIVEILNDRELISTMNVDYVQISQKDILDSVKTIL